MKARVVTFDCYGTLIDWESGIFQAFRDVSSIAPDRGRLLETFVEEEARIEGGEWRPYREVLAETARKVGERLDLSVGDGSFLADSLATWTPFRDVNPALEALRDQGVLLGVLSNIDDDLFAATRAHLTADFDFVITAGSLKSYKPAPAHFLEARRRVGELPWIHAAQSWYHDIVPACELGIRSAWINRRDEVQKATERGPEIETRDVEGLVIALAVPS
jgi:2-haloalkanoic acid dehalogenase type II